MLDHARLRQTIDGVDATILDSVTIDDLAAAPDDAYIDVWYGQDEASRYLNYTAHGSYYDLNGLAEAYPVTAYARVFHAADGRVAIQYWLFYYYNDWYNKHEGDWEMVQVELDADGQPAHVAYAQHQGGTVRPWDAVSKDGAHPRAYVAHGSHATYFVGDTLYPQGADIGSTRIEAHDRTGSVDPLTPAIQMISAADTPWLAFAGEWGERALRPSVIHRKVQGSFRSEWGARTYAVLATVLNTAKRVGDNVFHKLVSLMGAPVLHYLNPSIA